MESVGEIGLDLVLNQRQFNAQLQNITAIAQKAAKSIFSAFAIKKAFDFGKECIKLGSDLTEIQNVVDTAFPRMSEQVNNFAKNAMHSFGLSEAMAKRYTGTFGALAKSFGFAERDAYNMSTALTGLAGDIASFYNIGQDEVFTKLTSVFTGETEILKEVGVVMTQTALDSYAMANGFGKTTKEMSEAEKVALRYEFVLDRLSIASGDFIRTQDTWANQTRILNLQIESFKANIGQGLINLFTPVLKVINTLMAKLVKLAEIFKGFTELITGKKSKDGMISDTAKNVSDIADNASDASDNLSDIEKDNEKSNTGDSLSNASEAAKNLTDNTAAAGKAAKKAVKEMRALMGFDQINKLPEQNTDSDNDSSKSPSNKNPKNSKNPTKDKTYPNTIPSGIKGIVGAADLGQVADSDTILDKYSDKFDAIIKRAKELADLFKKGFWKGLGDYKPLLKELEKDWKSIKKNIGDIFRDAEVQNAIKKFVDSIAYNLGLVAGSFTRIGLAIAVNLVGGMEAYLSKNKGRIKKWIIEIFSTGTEINNQIGKFALALADIFAPVFSSQSAQNITGNIIGFFTTIGATVAKLALKIGRDLLNFFTQPIVENKDKIRDIFLGMLKPLSFATDTIENFVQYISDKINELYDQNFKPFVDNITNGISEITRTIINGWNTYVLPIIDELAQKFKKVFDEDMRKMVDDIVSFFARIINALNNLWVNYLQPFLKWMVENMMPIVAQVIKFIGELVIGNFELISKVVSDILEILNGAITFLSGVFTGDIKKTFDGLDQILRGFEDIVEDVFNFIVECILRPFNEWLKNTFGIDFSFCFDTLKGVLNYFLKQVETIWNSVKKVFNGIIDFLSGVFTGNWKRIWDGVKGIFSGIFNGIRDICRNTINGMIDIINGGIRGMNRIKIPNWVPGVGGMGINLPEIPHLAQGGYVKPNTPQLAMIGDNRHQGEIVAPESKLLEMAKIAAMASGGGRTDEELLRLLREILQYLKEHEIVEIDPEQLRKYFIRKTNQNTKSKGKCELIT